MGPAWCYMDLGGAIWALRAVTWAPEGVVGVLGRCYMDLGVLYGPYVVLCGPQRLLYGS